MIEKLAAAVLRPLGLYPEPRDYRPTIDLRRAVLCAGCEVLYEGPNGCPVCGCPSSTPAARWLRGLGAEGEGRAEVLDPAEERARWPFVASSYR